MPLQESAVIIHIAKIRHSNYRQGKIFVQMYSNPDEFPVSLISGI